MTATIVTLVLLGMSVTSPGGNTTPPVWGGGGPDDYGYRYIDSDTAGGPTYNWVDIRSIGEEVTGLGDDNIVGPFQIGFDFPYYWYTVSSFYLGSNGYIAFHNNTMNASPFHHVPSPRQSNNTVAPLLSDLYPVDTGTVHVYSNNADTCIIQFTAVPFWAQAGPTGANSFEIILTKADSSILFQYALQQGIPYNGWVDSSAQVGIENATGSVGLNYLSGSTPPGNAIEANLAVLFYPPESTLYEVHDAGMRNAMNDRSGGMFALRDRPMGFWGVAQNYGNQPESDFTSYVRVKRSSGSVALLASTSTSVPSPGSTDSIVFDTTWTPTTNGTYTIEMWTWMDGDANHGNDTAKVELQVLTFPGTLTYDSGRDTAHQYSYWNGPGGYGARFVPPVYPCSISAIRFNAYQTAQVAFGIFDDNGMGGSPGDTWHIENVSVGLTPQWHTVNLGTPVVITEGAFFVGAMSSVSQAPSFGMDTLPPFSGQGWEYTGVWAPSRDLWSRDPCFNAMVTATGIEEWVGPAPVPMPVRIDVNPNPLGATARLRLVNPRGDETAVELYDATGSIVRTLELRSGAATIDGRRLADGIYFCRVAGATSPVAKVVISH